jgi:hypothetical protein
MKLDDLARLSSKLRVLAKTDRSLAAVFPPRPRVLEIHKL